MRLNESKLLTFTLVLINLSACASRGPRLDAQSPTFHNEAKNPRVMGFLDKNNTYWEKKNDGSFVKTEAPLQLLTERSIANSNLRFDEVPTLFDENGILIL